MSKKQSGFILILIAVIMNVVGSLLSSVANTTGSAALVGFVALLMFSAVVVGLFGLFRLMVGLITKS